ncbi:MAG TPA: hypothetical protein VGQ81_06305 [Acidobacteriota bacterium]|nr:hypothetical protein [Acidobacteriota bacterium]
MGLITLNFSMQLFFQSAIRNSYEIRNPKSAIRNWMVRNPQSVL